MQQIADWLEKLGMSEYAQRFAENKIDVSVLRHLTDQDLKDIGVPLGHRPKILAAVSDLGGTTPVTTEPAAGSSRRPKTPPSAARSRSCSLRYFCSPQHTDSACYPIIGQMESPEDALAKRRVDTRIARRGKRRRSEPLAAQASTNATGKAGAGDSCAALSHGTHKRILSNTSTAPRLRRVCPPKS